MSSLLAHQVGFAHRGGADGGPGNTLQAFRASLAAGATALETDVRLTADGVPVLVHDDPLWTAGRRLPIRDTRRSRLPLAVPWLGDLYATCGTAYELAVDVLDPAAVHGVVSTARHAGAADRLWLCYPDPATLVRWRPLYPEVRLVLSTTHATMRRDPQRLAERLRVEGVDAVNVRARWWTRELVTQFHRQGRLVLGWHAETALRLRHTLATGCDGVFCDNVALLLAALRSAADQPADDGHDQQEEDQEPQ